MKYFALLTKLGENLLAQATALGTKIELTHMAVGDGGGKLPTPDTNQTKLIAEKRRAAINTLFIDEKNKNQIIAEQIIPEADGGWWIREIGLFDKAGNLIAVANCPETYKPQLAEGSGRTQSIRMVLIVSHTESVTLKIDPAVVLATRDYVNESVKKSIAEHEKSRNHPDATTSTKGFVQLTDILSADNNKAITPKLATEINQRAVNAQASANAANTAATNANNNANSRVPATRKINNKPLSTDITLTAGDVSAYTKSESDTKFQVKGNYLPSGYSYSKSESDTKYQPKGNYAPAGDYATNTALKNGLDGKFNKTGGKLLGGIAATGVSAEKIDSNHRVSIYPPADDNESSLAYFQYNNGSNWFGRTLIPKAPSGQTISLLSSENIVHVTGNSTANIISQKALTNALIGFNQKFEDLKSQREKNVLYTNTTGKPIFITVSVFTTSVVTGIGITLYIDNVKFFTRGGGSANDGTYKGTSATTIIPPGSSYKIESSGEIDSWGELR
ncbi:phage tail protein [Providencia stuartii]|uniref:phage tail protein n=1 Tax=Providencia stuartii TaxID=588 RepID=UPI000EF8CE03|nr:phage tail protein [Providencia stuartii]